MLSDLIPGDAKLIGNGNLSLDLNGNAKNMTSLRKTLSGSGSGNESVMLSHGSLAGINLEDTLLMEKVQLLAKEGQHRLATKFTETSVFTELKSTFSINAGKAHSNDFLLKSPLLSSKGEGEIAELKGITIPISINGTYAAPTITLNFSAASGGKKIPPSKPAQPAPVKQKNSVK